MKAILADTGPLYALADPSDQFHVRARTEIETIEKQGFQVAVGYPTICEAHTVVLRRLGGSYAREWLAEIFDGAVLLNPETADYAIAAAQLDRYRDKAITLVDSVTTVMAGRLGMLVWAFDRDFTTMHAKLWK